MLSPSSYPKDTCLLGLTEGASGLRSHLEILEITAVRPSIPTSNFPEFPSFWQTDGECGACFLQSWSPGGGCGYCLGFSDVALPLLC
jgi:hypothetical protein